MTATAPVQAPPRPAVCIVVLTWNGGTDTLALLATLCPQLRSGDRVLVVDNGSDDDTEAQVRARYPELTFVQNGSNLGFAGGNNTGLQRALEFDAPWILILNNDTLLEPGTIDRLLASADAERRRDATLGVVQPVLVRAADPNTIDSCGQHLGFLPAARDLAAGQTVEALPATATPIFGACGAATLMHRSALGAVGGFDDDLFVLFEDTDLACRVRAAGFTAALLPTIRIRHHRGVSGRHGRRDTSQRRRTFWLQRNLITIALRWWPTRSLLLAAPILLCRAAQALLLNARHRFGPCLGLWRNALYQRRTCRRNLHANAGDQWFGRDPLA